MILCIEKQDDRLVISFQDENGFHQLSSHATCKQVRQNGKQPAKRRTKFFDDAGNPVEHDVEVTNELSAKVTALAEKLLAGQLRIKTQVEGDQDAEKLLDECVKTGMKMLARPSRR